MINNNTLDFIIIAGIVVMLASILWQTSDGYSTKPDNIDGCANQR